MRPAVFAACLLSAVLGQTGCDPYPRAGRLADAFPPSTGGAPKALPRGELAALVWLNPPRGDPASEFLPEPAVRRILANLSSALNDSGELRITRSFLPSELHDDVSHSALAKAAQVSNVPYLMVVSVSGRQLRYPVRLRLDRSFLFPGMRTDLFLRLESGLFEAQPQQFLFVANSRGTAVLEEAAPGFEGTTSRFPQVYRYAFGDLHFGIRYPSDSPQAELGILAAEAATEGLVAEIKHRLAYVH